MNTFEENKTAKELGIDTSRKFVVVTEDNDKFEKGDILKFFRDDNTALSWFKKDGSKDRDWCIHWSSLAYAETESATELIKKEFSQQGLSIGDIVIVGEDEFKVLDVRELLFDYSYTSDFDAYLGTHTYKEAIKNGWRIKDAEPKSKMDEFREWLDAGSHPDDEILAKVKESFG